MTKQLLRKTRLEPLSEEQRWTPAQLSAFGELFPGFKQWYEANYDERGQVRREQDPELGEGLLCVDASLWEEIGKPETHDAWRKALLLPESYRIERIEHLRELKRFVLRVRHEAIPVVVGASYLPRVVPFYTRRFRDGQTSAWLAHIDIRVWDEQEGWQTVATTDKEGCKGE